ncbi:MAG: S8 family serine peptidase [Phaeodactylibacter sp.]|nr:S8 family serine peptidase [Phaeodactylibacter sp.]MCB9050109.1 S8 family serine peptidase [Lewinellaceae bacterium]
MRLQSLLVLISLALLAISCSKDKLDPVPSEVHQQEPMSKAEMDQVVENFLVEQNTPYRWQEASTMMLWSASVRSDSIMSLGYQPAGEQDVQSRIHEIDPNSEAWAAARDKLVRFVVEETNKAYPELNATAESLFLNLDRQYLPTLDVRIFDQRIIEALLKMPEVRYLEPMGYTMGELERRSDSGCGVTAASSIPTADYVTTAPSVKIPWNYYYSNIPAAWSTSTGAGIKVALIDTGTPTSSSQPKLGSEFNSGYSSGRSLERLGTHVSGMWWWASNDGPNDQCGHGTQMAGLIAAPRGSGGTSVGVAYNCNLKAFRATTDVVINGSSEKAGVRDALYISGNDGAVKIVSMSIGDVFYSSTVADGIYYAYNRGKMLIAAAGTSLSWTSWWGVIFPANMAQTVAVTGIQDAPYYTRCNTCHSGSEVDFVVVMQRASNTDRTSLTLAPTGNTPAYVGGSSAATATTAGIAALVWATNPSQSRNQVLDRMKQASQIYPSRNSEFGWGLINAAAAVQ